MNISRVSGVPILWGWDKCTIEGLVWKPDKSKPKNSGQPNTAVAVGIVIEAIRLDKLMEKILGNNFFSVAWFSEMTASKCPMLIKYRYRNGNTRAYFLSL